MACRIETHLDARRLWHIACTTTAGECLDVPESEFHPISAIRRVVSIVLALIVVGVCLWLINTYIPMAESIKNILNIVVVIATIVFVLQAVGLWAAVRRLWDDFTARHLPPHPRA